MILRKLTKVEAHTIKLECLKMAVMSLQPVQAKHAADKSESVLSAAESFFGWVAGEDDDD